MERRDFLLVAAAAALAGCAGGGERSDGTRAAQLALDDGAEPAELDAVTDPIDARIIQILLYQS